MPDDLVERIVRDTVGPLIDARVGVFDADARVPPAAKAGWKC